MTTTTSPSLIDSPEVAATYMSADGLWADQGDDR